MSIYHYTFIFLLLATLTALGQTTTLPPGGVPREFQLPKKNITKLPNGFSSTLVQYGEVPKVNINLIIKTGNIHEGPNEFWLADLTGNLMQEGTTTMDFKSISKKVAAMGGDVSISIGPNQMTISGSVLSEFAADFIAIAGDIAMNPKFPATELERLKNDLKRELDVQKSVPQNQAAEKFRSILYKDHPYGRYFPTEEMLNSYTLEMVKAFYNKNVGAKRSVIYVVGKFDEAPVTNAIETVFKNWKAGPEISYPAPKASATNEIAIIDRPDSPQTTILLGLSSIEPSNKDYLPLQITNSLLGGSYASRITANIRENKGYSYSPYSSVAGGYKSSIWLEEADVTTEHTGAALAEIVKEIKRLQQEAPSLTEVKGIQNYEAGIFVLQNSTRGGIINQLNFLDFHQLPDSYLTDRVKNTYAVSPQKMQEMAQKYLNYDSMTLVLVGDKKEIEKQIKQLNKDIKLK
jgi:zinc protease